jgi:hypothetical protein
MKHRFAFAGAVATKVPMGVGAPEQARVFGVTEGVTYQAAPKAIRDRFTLAVPADGSAARSGSKDRNASQHPPHKSNYAAGVPRDAHGRIARDPRARNEFKRTHPCPSTGKSSGSCPGYVIDHVQPLKRGGADTPANMQWQPEEAARLKDLTE